MKNKTCAPKSKTCFMLASTTLPEGRKRQESEREEAKQSYVLGEVLTSV
jgi:hypothetical protein